MTTKPKTKPYDLDAAQDQIARRSKLREWVQKAGGATAVAERSGLNRVSIEKLIADPDSGSPTSSRDILGMRAETIEKLLTALNVSDRRAQEELLIPERLRKRWQTVRPAPMGSGISSSDSFQEVVVNQPIQMLIEPGHTLTIDPEHIDSGPILVRLNGQYLILPAGAAPSDAESLGQVVGVHTLIRQKLR